MTQEHRTRVAVVGTGPWWGREHARVYAERPDVDLCAVVGRTPERAAARAREFGTSPYVDLGEMLERERPDLVSVCLANEGHFEPTLAVIRAGFQDFGGYLYRALHGTSQGERMRRSAKSR